MATIISVNNLKGGCNKTGTSIELAACLGNLGKKVLLVDLDQQCNLSDYVDCDMSKPNIEDLIDGDKQIDLNEAIQKKQLFDVICGSTGLSKADRKYIGMDDQYLLADTLDLFKDQYDYIIIDNQPSRSIIVTMSYVASDYIVIPTEGDDGSIKGVNSVIEDVEALRKSRNHISHAKILAIVLNRFENSTNHKDALYLHETIANNNEDKPIVSTIKKGVVVSEVKTYKTTIQEYSKYHNVAIDFRKLTNAIIERVEG